MKSRPQTQQTQVAMKKPLFFSVIFLLSICFSFSQSTEGIVLQVSPESVNMEVGENVQLNIKLIDEKGQILEAEGIRVYSRGRFAKADSTGLITALQPGEARIIVIYSHPDGKFLRVNVPTTVNHPPINQLVFVNLPEVIYTSTTLSVETRASDELNYTREDADITFRSSDENIAIFDAFNHLRAIKAGKVTLTASTGGVEVKQEISIQKNPIDKLTLHSDLKEVSTGDVIAFEAVAYDSNGQQLQDMAVSFSFQGVSDDVEQFASGLIRDDGHFVAYQSGMYRITAAAGGLSAQRHIKVSARQKKIKRPIELVGRGKVLDKHTSDLWVWEGIDGKDYAVTGTWGADGEAFFWDVTDPANMIPIDTIKVDARTVNDVKISEDGRISVISREGASNRKNGIFILDVSNPRDVKIHAEYSEGLTGGVHNVFIYKNHVYALSNGERYDIINIEDPTKPHKVGTFELDEPGHAIHDVWIEDGIAYSSNWHSGLQMVDVGNGIAGGTPSKPVKIGSYAYPSGRNHAAFPYHSKTTGKFYMILGDEAFPNGLFTKDKPTIAAGWIHVVDFTDLKNPKEVARFEVPEAGSHNFWVEEDILYLANYNAGLRVIDISGELMGDLYRQGREIGWFMPTDSQGIIPNAPMTWGPQPHKGHVFFSDWNSGLWSVKIKEAKLIN